MARTMPRARREALMHINARYVAASHCFTVQDWRLP